MDALKALLSAHGWRGKFDLVPLAGVGNNRAFRVQGESEDLFLKAYFQDPTDQRDRLGTEFAFVSFAWNKGLRSVAQPIAKDPANGLGLYEYMRGSPIQPAQIDSAMMKMAARFFQSINAFKDSPEAAHLPAASEAAFSLKDQLATVERRFADLANIETTLPVYAEAKAFVDNELRPAWADIAQFARREAKAAGLDAGVELSSEDRCLSPSDFGFHNALQMDNKELRFFDFEYAGWDDPAKMVSDFFHQPRMTISGQLMPAFVNEVVSQSADPAFQRLKIGLVRPVFGIKWSAIMLNDFLPLGQKRRQFSLGTEDLAARLRRQLDKSRAQLKRLTPLTTDLNVWN